MNRKRKTAISMTILVAVCVLSMTVCIVYGNGWNVSGSGDTPLSPDSGAKSWDDTAMEKTNQQGGVKIPGYGAVFFPKDTKAVPMTLYNPKENSCLFTFALYIADEETPVYTSGYIEPGTALTEIELAQPLGEGDYTLRIRINTYDIQTKAAGNNAVVKTSLTAG